jgi:transposase InsO family protein
MGVSKKQKRRPRPDGESPFKGGRSEAGVGRRGPGRPKGKAGDSKTAQRKSYTAEERRAAVEAFEKSGLTQDDFSRVWGVSKGSLKNWITKYRNSGPKSLERKPHGGKGKSRLAKALKAEIVRTKHLFPDFGLKRIRDYLCRFRGVKVSPGAIKKTLDTEKVPSPLPPVQKKARRKPPARRFERSKPGALWQSDITSYVMTRHGTRAYLTVFLDDYSRYVVSYALALHQKGEMVTEALLSGIDRFGKPKEVLTDQGRQYFSWRGKSSFQKLLEKQGIRHVVARSHHPQTLGKCERLWKTIQEEFWSRAHPQELEEARKRLGHFLAHYNHSRPHQGIGGLVPADRFFGAESEVRRELEAQHAKNELHLALGEAPRRSVYLVGRIGDREVSMHGERGKLVIHTPEGAAEELHPEQLGMAQEENDGAREAGDGDSAGRPPEKTGALPDAEAGGRTGESTLGVGGGGGAEEGPRDGGGHSGTLAGANEPPGSGQASPGPAAEGVAALPAGAFGAGSGPAQATEGPGQDEGLAPGEQPLETSGPDCEAGERGGELTETRGPTEGTSGASGQLDGPGGETCPDEEGNGEPCPGKPGIRSGEDCKTREPKKESGKPWPEPTV